MCAIGRVGSKADTWCQVALPRDGRLSRDKEREEMGETARKREREREGERERERERERGRETERRRQG